jgi:hypothetical protein
MLDALGKYNLLYSVSYAKPSKICRKIHRKTGVQASVADPDPDPPDPHFLLAIVDPDPDPSITKHKQ